MDDVLDHEIHDLAVSSYSSITTNTNHDQFDHEPDFLLEKTWFFGNLLENRKSRMLRCYSEDGSSCSSKTTQNLSMDETYSSLRKLDVCRRLDFRGPGLINRTPSMPPCVIINDEEDNSGQEHGDIIIEQQPPRRDRSNCSSRLERPCHVNLMRTPSLPIFVESEETPDEESDFSMGKLIRQASLNHDVNVLPPKYTSKGITKCASISSNQKHHPTRIYSMDQSKRGKSLGDLEIQELQSFKDLDLNNEKKDLSSNKKMKKKKKFKKPVDPSKEHNVRRAYVSESWQGQSIDQNWVGNKSSEDMKEQIKFWARAVASNVRQEC